MVKLMIFVEVLNIGCERKKKANFSLSNCMNDGTIY